MKLLQRTRFDEWHDASLIAAVTIDVHAGERVAIGSERDLHDLLRADAVILVDVAGLGVRPLAPGHPLWLPAGAACTLHAERPTTLQSLAFWKGSCAVPSDRAMIAAPTALVGELYVLLASGPHDPQQRYHAERLLLASLEPERYADLPVLLPTDDRARIVAERLLAAPADHRSLAAWGQLVGASARTLARRFRVETGLTYPQWRRAARVALAERHIAAGASADAAALRAGYASPAALAEARRAVHLQRDSPIRATNRRGELPDS